MSEIIDNKAHRVRTLKHIIKHLHAGEAPEQVRAQMLQLVRETDHSEIIAMEQELMAEGMPVEEVRSMCDLHSQVTRDVLVSINPRVEIAPGHPVDTFRRENEALTKCLASLQAAIDGSSDDFPTRMVNLRSAYNDVMDVEKHYQRKEHALFSCLERHGITGHLR